ncbi:PhzF family phenazine biosynthesis protein [Halopseudomonas oceani]|uniref:PhzF family phenazine biosynthesis protein n=1 Tax=Halopseudomonas oceani TaxID=1708783 RepID=UPI002AA797FF|nr:PhzF family phenazine biosynthesis protein [Halopseudomonas oceani]
MQLSIFQVDAFTDTLFGGNYAAVVPLADWLSAELMQAIAAENNVSETAFVVKQADGGYAIRWFSPLAEIDFCGHATLAAAFVLFRLNPDTQVLRFRAAAVGELSLSRETDGLIHMDAPRLAPEPVEEAPALLLDGLSIRPDSVLVSRQAWFAVYADEGQVRAVEQDPELIRQLAPRDVVVTAPGHEVDFVSRYFWPANGGLEDMVTGSIHAGLAPYWAERLGCDRLVAVQASARCGRLYCQVEAERVRISGYAVLYLEGCIHLPD